MKSSLIIDIYGQYKRRRNSGSGFRRRCGMVHRDRVAWSPRYCANSKSNSTSNFHFTIKHHSRRSRSPLAPTSIAGSRRIPCPRAQGCFSHEQESPFSPEEYTSEHQLLRKPENASSARTEGKFQLAASFKGLPSLNHSITHSLTHPDARTITRSQ